MNSSTGEAFFRNNNVREERNVHDCRGQAALMPHFHVFCLFDGQELLNAALLVKRSTDGLELFVHSALCFVPDFKIETPNKTGFISSAEPLSFGFA